MKLTKAQAEALCAIAAGILAPGGGRDYESYLHFSARTMDSLLDRGLIQFADAGPSYEMRVMLTKKGQNVLQTVIGTENAR
jgi:hypothetical protein